MESIFSDEALAWLDGMGENIYNFIVWADSNNFPALNMTIWDFMLGLFGLYLSVWVLRKVFGGNE